MLLGLTRSLQQEAKDIVQAVSEVTTLTSMLEEVRENVDSYHSNWFKTVCDVWGGRNHSINAQDMRPSATQSEYPGF